MKTLGLALVFFTVVMTSFIFLRLSYINSEYANPQIVIHNEPRSAVIANVGSSTLSTESEMEFEDTLKVDNIVLDDLELVTIIGIRSRTTAPEPTDENADMPATGEYADQINLMPTSCESMCADSDNVESGAAGLHADEVNIVRSELELGRALFEGETELLAPPTQTGAYILPD